MPKFHVRVGYPNSERVDEFLVTAEHEQQAGEKAVGQSQLRVLSVREVEKLLVANEDGSQNLMYYLGLAVSGYAFFIFSALFFILAMKHLFSMVGQSWLIQAEILSEIFQSMLNGVIFMAAGFALLAFRDLVINSRQIGK